MEDDLSYAEQDHRTISETSEPADFASITANLNENLAEATLRLVDATGNFTSLIKSFVSAGQELKRSLAIHRELGAASQKAVEAARESATQASSAAAEAKDSHVAAQELVNRAALEHGGVTELVESLRERIAALSILASPLPHTGESAPDEPETNPGIRIAS